MKYGDGDGGGRQLARVAAAVGLLLSVMLLLNGCSGEEGKESGGEPGASAEGQGAATPAGPEATAAEEKGPAGDVAERFLKAMADRHYDEMWELLATASRQAWGEAGPFVGFLERKFGGVDLSVSLGEPAPTASWRDAETGTGYEGVVAVPLRLRVDGQEAQEFSLTPLVLAKEDGRWRVAGLGPAARRAPLPGPPPTVQKSLSVPILVYHHVRPVWPKDFEGRTLTVITSAFEEELAYLRDSGYRSVTLSELANGLFYGLSLPEKPVVLTFDDGYDDAFTDAFPLLQRYGFSGSFALPTGLIGGPGYLTWDQAKQMSEGGMEFVSHTVNHASLGGLTDEQASAEVRQSKADLEAKLGQPVQVLIYPYGEPFAHGTVAQQQAVVDVLRREGYVVGVTNPLPNEPPNLTQQAERPYGLRRLMVSGGMSLSRFVARLGGTGS